MSTVSKPKSIPITSRSAEKPPHPKRPKQRKFLHGSPLKTARARSSAMLDWKTRPLIYFLDGTHLTVIHKQKVNPSTSGTSSSASTRSQRTATAIPPDFRPIDSSRSRSSPYSRSCIMGCLCSRLYASSRMLKMSASFVLASLRGSTYGTEYDSPLRSLRPRWTTILSILRAVLAPAPFVKSQRGLSGN